MILSIADLEAAASDKLPDATQGEELEMLKSFKIFATRKELSKLLTIDLTHSIFQLWRSKPDYGQGK